jgi:delta-1-pyrroline-5-carboxylate synthetase
MSRKDTTCGFQVQAATWALNRGVSVVICNGMQEKAIKFIMAGRKIGTFFTNAPTANTASVETLADNGRWKLSQSITLSIDKSF